MRDEYDWANFVFSLLSSDATDPLSLTREAGLDPKSTDLEGVDFSGIDFSGQDMRDWNLKTANLTNAVLRGADLRGAKLNAAGVAAAIGWEDAILDESVRDKIRLITLLGTPIAQLELSVRASNCLRNSQIFYLANLLPMTEAKLLRLPNFGRKVLNEVKEMLAGMGLHLGMDVSID